MVVVENIPLYSWQSLEMKRILKRLSVSRDLQCQQITRFRQHKHRRKQ